MRISDWSSDVCSSDLGEYVPAAAERLAWLTGFKGPAGFACVLLEEAAVFVDGRYTLQVVQEVDTPLFTPRHVTAEPLAPWLEARLKPGERQSVVKGLQVSVSVDHGGRRNLKKKRKTTRLK